MKLNKLAPGAHRFAVSAFAVGGCLTLVSEAVTPWYGDYSILLNSGTGEQGNLTIAKDLEVGGDISGHGVIDFGNATSNAALPGATMGYLGTAEHSAAFDLTDSLGSFLWRDNTGATARPKMKLGTDNILSLYNSTGSSATITLQGGTGQMHLTGTGSGIYANGSSIFTVGSTGSITWDRVLGITNTSGSALTVAGGIGVGLDSYFNGIRIGKGNNGVSQNTAFGREALNANTTGNDNTAIGMYAMRNNTSGQANTAVGSFALQAHTSGEYNAAFGASALGGNTTGSYNSAFGKSALNSNTTAHSNSAFGYDSLRSNTSGASNAAVGRNALYSNSTGYYNTGLGTAALTNNTTGSLNVAIGYFSGRYQADGMNSLTDPENSIYIGSHTRGFSNLDSNSIVIGYQAIGEGANTTVIGSSSTTSTHLYGQTKADSLKVNGATDLNDQVVVEPAVAPATAVRAMRVLADGTILVKPSGDLSMGSFTSGDQP